MTIRPATEADVPVLLELAEALDHDPPVEDWLADDWDKEAPAFVQNVRAGGVLVAEDDGAIAGFVEVELHSRLLGEIDRVYVRPDARRRGIATRLLAEAAALLRARGVEHVYLEVLDRNTPARALYAGLGFVPFSRNVVVELAELERRAAGAPAGETYGAVHVRSEDAAAVERGARQYVPRLGRSAGTVVAGPAGGWVTVADELADRDPRLLRRLARELSDRMGSIVLALGVEDGAVVRYVLLDRGRVADEYASVPEYHGPLPPGDVVALAANAPVAERLAGADPARLRAVAKTAPAPAELPAADELLAGIAAAFGLAGPLRYASSEG